jgi:putative phosphoesterase
MKHIGLISDTHGFLDDKIFQYFDKCDEIWHAGDIGSTEVSNKLASFRPLKAVYGNIDGNELRQLYPLDQVFNCEGMKVWMTHIGGTPGKYPAFIKKKLVDLTPDLFICGHSHILRIISDKTFRHLYLNPGAAGVHGFHTVRTLLRFHIGEGKLSDMQVIELGKRGVN